MNNTNKKLFSISEAANYLGISEKTLRRWDENGTFNVTFRSPGGHRYYALSDLEKKTKGIFKVAQEWVSANEANVPEKDFYCPTSDIFKARHERMTREINNNISLQATGIIFSSAAGEIGNNSFDHNLGNWPDIMGTFFAYDLGKRRIVLADRGVGILATLRHVRPELKNDQEALRVAFTEYVTGRATEHRGNGLKYVIDAIKETNVNLFFQSGNATLEIIKGQADFIIKEVDSSIRGCLALIEF